MPVYMVERDLPGIEMEQLAAAQKAAIETSNQFTADGKPVRYIRTTFVPGASLPDAGSAVTSNIDGVVARRNGEMPGSRPRRSAPASSFRSPCRAA